MSEKSQRDEAVFRQTTADRRQDLKPYLLNDPTFYLSTFYLKSL